MVLLSSHITHKFVSSLLCFHTIEYRGNAICLFIQLAMRVKCVDPDLRAADQSQTEPFWPLPKKPGSFTGAIHETVDWFGIPHWPGPIFLGCHAALLGSQRVCMLSNNTWALVHNQILKKKSVWTTDLAICLHFTDLSNAKWWHLVIDITDTRNLHWTTTLDQD